MTITEQLRKLKAAVPGELEISKHQLNPPQVVVGIKGASFFCNTLAKDDEARAALIVAAINNLDALLDVAEAAQQVTKFMQDMGGSWRCYWGDMEGLTRALVRLGAAK